MRNFWKATLAALSITAFIGLAGGASAQPYDDYGYDNAYGDPYAGDGYGDPYANGDYGYGAPDGVPYDVSSGGYCDEYGCPDDYYDLPVYYGSAYYDGIWFNGPLYYRDFGGGRQFWLHGGWHYDSWRGARPSWYREGRYGPALGRSFYSSNRFRGGYSQRGYANRGGFGNRNDFNRGYRNDGRDFNRGANRGFGGFNRDGNRGFGARGDNGSRFGNRSFAAPQQQAAPQAQPQQDRGNRFGGQRFGQGQGFQRSDAGRQDRFQNRGGFQRNDSQRSDSGGGHGWSRGGGGNRDRGGDRHR